MIVSFRNGNALLYPRRRHRSAATPTANPEVRSALKELNAARIPVNGPVAGVMA